MSSISRAGSTALWVPAADRDASPEPSSGAVSFPPNGRIIRALPALSRTLLGLVAALSALALLGWSLDIQWLSAGWLGLTPLKPNAAVAFLLAAIALFMRKPGPGFGIAHFARAACSILVGLIALLTLLEYAFAVDLKVDQILFRDVASSFGPPGRMAIATAGSLLLLACSLMLLFAGFREGISQALAICTGLVSLVGLTGYVVDVKALYGFAPYSSMSIHAIISSFALSVCILLARPDVGVAAVLVSASPSGRMLRRLFPAGILLPIAAAALAGSGQRAGWYRVEVALCLEVVTTIIAISGLLYWNAFSLRREEQMREGVYWRLEHQDTMVNLSHDAIVSLDSEWRIVAWNRGSEELYGWKEFEAKGRVIHELLRTRSNRSPTEFDTALEANSSWHGVVTQTTKDGRELIVESRHVCVRDQTGQATGVLEINRDITESRRAEQERREAADTLRTIFNSVYDGIVVHSLDGTIIEVNDRCLDLYALSREEFLQASIAHDISSLANEPVKRLPAIWAKVMAGEPQSFEWKARRPKDGSEFDAEVHLRRVPLRGKDVILATVRDITVRKRIEQALRQSEERVRLALSAASIGTWDLDPISGKLQTDERCKAAFGLPAEAPLDYETLLSGLHPDDRSCVSDFVNAALNPAGTGEYNLDYRTVGLRDGIVRHVHAHGQAFFSQVNGRQRATRFIGTVQDITARKRDEEALLKANEDLRQFAYAAAHDLQEPLRNISTSLGLVKRFHQDVLPSQAAELVDRSIANAKRMIQMVKDLLAFAEVIGDTQRRAEPVDTHEVLRQVLENLRTAILDSRAKITVERLPRVSMAVTHLLQLFQNLIGNALKYGKPDVAPVVQISAERREAAWLFTVSDNGIGFDPVYAERIFGVFKRLHRSHEYSGTGIGLAICERIVTSYGGQIWAESQIGVGSRFKFTVAGPEGK